MENLEKLIKELCRLPSETEWLEFKCNNYEAEILGQNISALANSAALKERDYAYMVWGIHDKTHEIVGTNINEYSRNIVKPNSNQEIGSWLRNSLSPNADFEFHHVEIESKTVVLLRIRRAVQHPVTFKKIEYVRIGSYTKPLREYASLSARLWSALRLTPMEKDIVKSDLPLDAALRLLDYTCYFDLQNKPQPSDNVGISHPLIEDGILTKQDNGLFGISFLGALLFAKKISDFPHIARKTVRVAQYEGENRLHLLKENEGTKGYVVGFEGLLDFIEALLPSREEIVGAIREKWTALPAIAIREVVANALIHQDFSVSGTGPTIEVFSNRIEVTNPGNPLVDIFRIVDNPPKSRNEGIATLLRRLGICEELGTGWDKIVFSCEKDRLPAPRIVIYEENTRVFLYTSMPFSSIAQEDKIWACYLHASILYLEGKQLTNSTLRERFDLKETGSGMISRLIKETVQKKYIKALDPETGRKYMKYIPIWG